MMHLLKTVVCWIGVIFFGFWGAVGIIMSFVDDPGTSIIIAMISLGICYLFLTPILKARKNEKARVADLEAQVKSIEASQTSAALSPVSTIEPSASAAPRKRKKRSDFVSDFTVIDFETTGFNPKIHRVVEIGAVKFRNGEPVDKFRTYVNPKRKIPKAASDVNFITDDMVAGEPTFYEVIDDFTDFIGDDVIVAHNASFDLGFLQGYVDRHKKKNPDFDFELNNAVVDTVKLAREHFPEAPNHKLETLKSIIGMDKYQSHTAADDCMVTGTLYLKCKERAEQ